MSITREFGWSERVAIYEVSDDQLAVGSTLGGPKVAAIIKATGALQKVYSIDLGQTLFGTVLLRHYDERNGMYLAPRRGNFIIHPEHQEHVFSLSNGVTVHETVFVLSTETRDRTQSDPPAVYLSVELQNVTQDAHQISTYAAAELRGETAHDITAIYEKNLGALVAWNASAADQARVFGCVPKPKSFETTLDYARAVAQKSVGELSGTTDAPADPLGILHLSHALKPGESARFYLLLSCGVGRTEAEKNYRACPDADAALVQTKGYYHDMLSRSVMVTPNPQVNRGVLWAKANMLRVQVKSPTGWCFVNDPTRSNNSVGRDTAWYAYGGDYLTPQFVRDSLLAYVRNQEKNGKIVEYYDIRNDKTADYKLNINDDTPLMVLALWHHYNTTGDEDFLKQIYPAATKAGRYILSQRNDHGLVWCTATGTADWGIVGWRNVIQNYRLSGATTEVNSECYAALKTISDMARVLGKHDVSAQFEQEAEALREAINAHLLNPDNGLYYLNIDVDGFPRSNITSDLVFPVMFGVADDKVAARIITRLSDNDFWTPAGMRTTPRDAPDYTPIGGWGLLGGVWVAVSFWYAFAAARFNPEFMDYALGASFQNFSSDPRRNNTVPGQFSEWLHGETLVNEGMMLSPWDPPRYLWAAVEGAAGLDITGGTVTLTPRLASDWKWMGVQNLPYRDQYLTWFAVRAPDVQIYSNFHPQGASASRAFEEDITHWVHAGDDSICVLGLRQKPDMIVFAGNTSQQTTNTSLRLEADLQGAYRVRSYESLLGEWEDRGLIPAEHLKQGTVIQIERKGFCLLEIRQEV